jgi:2-dehydro-3-deoxyphosphogluconate aldolase / (4S)-4-hydroxy-2-oxoglutarate aldolase
MSQAFDSDLAARIEAAGVIAVLVIDRVEDALPLAKALLDGGVNVMELTLRTSAGLAALREIRRGAPEMVAGAGTVLSPEQVDAVKEAGAAFAVAPGVSRRVLEAAAKAGISFAPGIATPSDIEVALEYGCKLLKFFPAEPLGGLTYLKAISAPYAHLGVKYLPLGGLNDKNMAAYLTDPLISALGGSWIAPRDLIKAGDWQAITANAAKAVEFIASTRKSS